MALKQLLFVILLLVFGLFGEVRAEKRETIIQSKHWFGFKHTKGDSYSCYMVSEPISEEGKNNNRDYVNAYVTHRPFYDEYDEVSFNQGYKVRKIVLI